MTAEYYLQIKWLNTNNANNWELKAGKLNPFLTSLIDMHWKKLQNVKRTMNETNNNPVYTATCISVLYTLKSKLWIECISCDKNIQNKNLN